MRDDLGEGPAVRQEVGEARDDSIGQVDERRRGFGRQVDHTRKPPDTPELDVEGVVASCDRRQLAPDVPPEPVDRKVREEDRDMWRDAGGRHRIPAGTEALEAPGQRDPGNHAAAWLGREHAERVR